MRIALRTLCFFSLLFFTLTTHLNRADAAGFAILEQSAEGIGLAYAGAAAGYGDGSEIAFNPAAMSWLPSSTLASHSSHLIITSAKFSNEGSNNPALGGLPLGGSNGPDGGLVSYVPSVYVTGEPFSGTHVGFGINAPFGLSSEYDSEWVGRYRAIKSELTTIQLTPAVSTKITDNFSIGGSVNVMYADAELSNAIDFGTLAFGQLGSATASALGFSPQGNDGRVEIEGDDWGVGFTLGASYKYGENSKVGIAWRSKTSLELRGEGDFTVPTSAAALNASGAFNDQNAVARTTLPESISVGWQHELNNQWELLAETQWTRWSRFNELRVSFDGLQPDAVEDESWGNVWRYSLGVRWNPCECDKWNFTTGWTFDEEPIPDAERRSPRIPGNDRNWLAFGANYQSSENLNFKLTYAHLFVKDGDVNIVDSVGNNIRGTFDNQVDLIGLGVDYVF